jgi:4-hydroxy-tetrahydrodipicolinate synthase
VQIPTIKAMVGLKTGNAGWNRVRPPMLPLAAAQLAELEQKFVTLP